FAVQPLEVDVLSNEHQFLPAIAKFAVAFAEYRRAAFSLFRPMRFGREMPPATGIVVTHQATGLRPATGFLRAAGQPEEPFGAQQPAVAPLVVEEIEEALRVEGAAGQVTAGGDAELLGFRNVFATYFLEPARRLGRPFEVEAVGVEDALQRHLTHAHWQDLGVSIEAAEDGAQFLAFGGRD